MIAYLDDVTGHLDSFIASRYEFRQNLVQKILDGEMIEYRRLEWNFWLPISKFTRRERNEILKSTQGSFERFMAALMPEWLLQRIVMKHGEVAEEYVTNQNFLKILNEAPSYVEAVSPADRHERRDAELAIGDKCYVCLGYKRRKSPSSYQTLPGIVESTHFDGKNHYYNVFVIKYKPENGRVSYHGRHMLLRSELGETPEHAVENMALSQIIY